MPKQNEGDGQGEGRGELMFIVASAVIFLAIAGCVVYFVVKIL